MPHYELIVGQPRERGDAAAIRFDAPDDSSAVDRARQFRPFRRRQLWRDDLWVEELPPEAAPH